MGSLILGRKPLAESLTKFRMGGLLRLRDFTSLFEKRLKVRFLTYSEGLGAALSDIWKARKLSSQMGLKADALTSRDSRQRPRIVLGPPTGLIPAPRRRPILSCHVAPCQEAIAPSCLVHLAPIA